MIKVAMIGAGSVVFSRNLTGDILSYPEFRNATLAYMDVDPDRLAVAVQVAHKVASVLDAHPRVEATTDRREALRGADFVINMVQIGGFEATLIDFEIPRKYGLNFTVADTTGPGGLFRALRTFPMLRGLCEDLMALCPRAWLLNYTNPMGMNMQTVYRTSGVQGIGLCHSVQGTLQELARYAGVQAEEVSFLCAGINHMAFFLKLEHRGKDLYPCLFRVADDTATRASNPVRFEIMKRVGYFPTESSGHHAEYSPYFIPHGAARRAAFAVPIDAYLRSCAANTEQFERLRAAAAGAAPLEVHRSHEYGSRIIHAMVTGQPAVVHGNMPNWGAIANLPATAIVEAPTLVDRTGAHFTTVGELPPEVLGYIQPHLVQQELFIRAALEGRRDHVYQAVMYDPLTAATLTPDQIVAMCDELIAAHGPALPNLDAKRTLVPSSGRTFPPTDGRRLREQWEQREAGLRRGAIKSWWVIGPFAGESPGRISLELATPLEAELGRRGDGAVDTTAPCRWPGGSWQWRECRANDQGMVDLLDALGAHEFCVAYAYTEFDSPGGETRLWVGSDDGIRIWLNGVVVHNLDTIRGCAPASDCVPVRLERGRNRLLVKITQGIGQWGFTISVEGHVFV